MENGTNNPGADSSNFSAENSTQVTAPGAVAITAPARSNLFRDNRMTFAAGALSFSLLAGGLGWAWAGNSHQATTQNSSAIETQPIISETGTYPTPGSGYGPGLDSQPGGSFGDAQQLPYDQGGMTATDTTSLDGLDVTEATADQTAGIVVIETELNYSGGEAAGTGIVLTDDGLVLTNHHVVAGATSITVTTADGTTYAAELVGSDATSDVALLELKDASGLTVAQTDSADDLAVGDEVTAVGNALGEGLIATPGTVSARDQSITTQDEATFVGQELANLIEIDADVVSGDSGGAALDADGDVIGMTTAASSGTQDIVGYAIDIDDALAIVSTIQAGDESGTVTLGYPAFLGIGLAAEDVTSFGYGRQGLGLGGSAGTTTTTTTNGVEVAEVYADAAAAEAGLTSGDVIKALDGTAVTMQTELSDLIAAHDPGDSVTIEWTDTAGATHSATVTLTAGPVA